MRGIRLKPMGRYPAMCLSCRKQIPVTWNQKRSAEAGALWHECATGRLITAPRGVEHAELHPDFLNRVVMLVE